MDTQQLAALLQESQIPDTTRIKAITAELQKNYYSKPESVLSLIEIVCTNGDVGVRQQAAVQAARLVPRHWKATTPEQRAAVHDHLMQATLKEQNAKCRHSDAHLIAAISSAYETKESQWPQLIPALFTLINSSDVTQREIGSYILYSTLEGNPVLYRGHIKELLELFSRTINDPVSADVRVNTVMAIGALLVLVEASEDDEAESDAYADAIQSLVPPMGLVLKACVDAADDDKIQAVFDALQQFLVASSAFIGGHLKSLLQFMIDLAANKDADEDVRVQAMAFLIQAIQYRRLKIQAMKDMAAEMVIKGMQILTEISDDDSTEEESPGHVALTLLDTLASELPPRQVLVPLLDEFPKYAASPDPALRKAAILALGNCAEGAPDFVNTQLKSILPVVIALLNDPNEVVRHAALVGLTGLADEMAEEIAVEHEAIMAALVRNLQAAMEATNNEETASKNGRVIRAVCSSFDALSRGFKADVMKLYGHEMIKPIAQLFSHPDLRVKIAAAGALGAIAASLEQDFGQYLEKSMQELGAYINIKGDDLELQLRSAVLETICRIAVAVGSQLFQPYVVDLMKASEENLSLDDDRLKESSFFFWASLAKVYGRDFKPFLPGVFKALIDTLEEEDGPVIQFTEEEKAIMAAGGVKGSSDSEDDMDDDDDDSDDDWAGLDGEGDEKEVALDVLGDIITHACFEEEIQEYLEKVIDIATGLTENFQDNVRKAAISTLWRSYTRVWKLSSESTGVKWEPGYPPKAAPSPLLTKLADLITKPTLEVWTEEMERDVVTEINRNVAATLEACGPTVIAQQNSVQEIMTILGQLITRSHPCQQDIGEDDEVANVEESSEYDWLVIDTALDVLIALSTALGPAFGELWKVFEKPIVKLTSSNESYERSSAVGTIGGCIAGMGSSVTPYTGALLKVLVHRLSDEDVETKSNAAYAIGHLITNSTDSKTYLASFPSILEKLGRLFALDDNGRRVYDNATGALCRLITAHPDRVPIDEYLPMAVEKLPLKEDYDENKPIYTCIYHLYEHNEPTVQQLTPQLIPVFEQVLSPPEEQLDAETRQLIQLAVQHLFKAQPQLFAGHEALLKLAGAA